MLVNLLGTFPDCSCQKLKRTHEQSSSPADVRCSTLPGCRSETFSATIQCMVLIIAIMHCAECK